MNSSLRYNFGGSEHRPGLEFPARPFPLMQTFDGASHAVLVVKNLLAHAGDIKDMSSVLGWKDSLEESKATHSSILTWRILWTEELGRLQSMESQSVTHD